jgi:hypothetical protein
MLDVKTVLRRARIGMCKIASLSNRMGDSARVIRSLSCAAILLAPLFLVFSQTRLVARQQDFTRPTLVARTIQARARWRQVIFEDPVYKFVTHE